MKKKTLKHGIVTLTLLTGLVFSFAQVAHANPPVKFIVSTVCCNNGAFTGYSNDCDAGDGSCVNHSCGDPGSTEYPRQVCL